MFDVDVETMDQKDGEKSVIHMNTLSHLDGGFDETMLRRKPAQGGKHK